jgi:hypothetical protein
VSDFILLISEQDIDSKDRLQGVFLSVVCTRVMFIANEPSEFAITGVSEISYLSFASERQALSLDVSLASESSIDNQ